MLVGFAACPHNLHGRLLLARPWFQGARREGVAAALRTARRRELFLIVAFRYVIML